MNKLVDYYDLILADQEGTKQYFDFCVKHDVQSPILELASGSGDLSLLLQDHNYHVIASDIDQDMLTVALSKGVSHYRLLNMTDIDDEAQYQTILCFGDSTNYLSSLQEFSLFLKNTSSHLVQNGRLLFDMHHVNRLHEFSEEYIEEGNLELFQYQWRIYAEGNQLFHDFIFFDQDVIETQQIIQTIFNQDEIELLLHEHGFSFQKLYDFEFETANQHTEKVFYVCKKGEVE